MRVYDSEDARLGMVRLVPVMRVYDREDAIPGLTCTCDEGVQWKGR